MSIQWFPGHMTRARRQIEEKLKLIDVAIELLDARLPESSRNPMIDTILRNKPRLVLLNKADLADPQATACWIRHFAGLGLQALAIDAASGTHVREIAPRCMELLREKREALIRKGVQPRAIRALIVGIPNVGKSTLINRLAGRSAAATGDRPGVTKGQQWIKAGNDLELLDTPGILWPKFEDENVGFRLAATGAIRDEIWSAPDVAFFILKFLLRHYPEQLKTRYALADLPEDAEATEKIVGMMEDIGRKRGCLLGGGRIDMDKTAMMILRDLRSGKLGRITLELPDDSGRASQC